MALKKAYYGEQDKKKQSHEHYHTISVSSPPPSFHPGRPFHLKIRKSYPYWSPIYKYHCLFINYYYYKKQSLSTLSYFMMDLNVLMKSILEILLKTCQRRGIFKDFRFRNPLIGKLDKWSLRMEGVNSIVLVLTCCFWVTRRKSFLGRGGGIIISIAKMRKLIKVW